MVPFGFYALSVVMVLLSYFILRKYDVDREVSHFFTRLMILWFLYLTLIYGSGIVRDFSLPPRVPLLVILPALGLIIWGTGLKRFQGFISNVPAHVLLYVQSFRILVELLIYGAFLLRVFPERVTFAGLNFDIVVGISALLAGWAAKRGVVGKQGILLWNIIALCILSLTGYSFVSSYFFFDFPADVDKMAFTRLPYLLLPAVLLPFAVFYHVLSIRQQLRR